MQTIGRIALLLAVLGAIFGLLLISLGLADQIKDQVGNALVWTQIGLFCLWGGGRVYEEIKKESSHH